MEISEELKDQLLVVQKFISWIIERRRELFAAYETACRVAMDNQAVDPTGNDEMLDDEEEADSYDDSYDEYIAYERERGGEREIYYPADEMDRTSSEVRKMAPKSFPSMLEWVKVHHKHIPLHESDVDFKWVLECYHKIRTPENLSLLSSLNLPVPLLDLSYASFSEIDLREAKLNSMLFSSADFSGVNLARAHFVCADLADADFTQADLTRANLMGAHLRRACFNEATLIGTQLLGVDLVCAKFRQATLISTNYAGSNLLGADFTGVRLIGVIFQGADLSLAGFADATLSCVHFEEAILTGVDAAKASFTGVVLTGSILSMANFSETVFNGVDFTDAVLIGADFRRADLTAARCTRTLGAGADFTGAKLNHADLTDANLVQANLAGADLTGTKLDNVCLQGANLSGAVGLLDIRLTQMDHRTQLPEGYMGIEPDLPIPAGAHADAWNTCIKELPQSCLGVKANLPILTGTNQDILGIFVKEHSRGAEGFVSTPVPAILESPAPGLSSLQGLQASLSLPKVVLTQAQER